MKKNNFILLIIAIALVSCSTSPDVSERGESIIIAIDPNNEPENISNYDIIKDVEIYSLKSDSILLYDIDKMIYYKNKFYILDIKSKHVIIGDTLNNLTEINQFGQGPEEYLQLVDITIDPQKETLNLISRIDRKMFKYDLDGMQLKDIATLPKAFFNFSKTNWGYIGYIGNYDSDGQFQNIWTLSDELILGNSYMDMDLSWNSVIKGSIHPFSHYKENTYYIQFLDNNIYSIDKDDLHTPYSIDFGKANWPKDKKRQQEYSDLGMEGLFKYIDRINLFQETEKYLIFYFIFQGQDRLGIYEKESNKTYYVYLDSPTDKYFFSFGNIIGMDENAIYTTVSASHIAMMLRGGNEYNDFEKEHPQQIKNLRERFKDITVEEEDNPFLVIYSFN